MAEADTSSDLIKITIRQSNGDQTEVSIAKTATVADLKKECEAKIEIPAAGQRLIFKGRILKDE
jgi:hypothetical protein